MKEELVQSSVEEVYVKEEQLKEEEALRKSEEKFRNIFEKASDCMIFLDVSGRILEVNGKAVEVFGGSREELLGKHFIKVGIFSIRDTPTLMSNFANILAGKKITLHVSIKNKRGREIPLECSASLMKVNGKVASILVIARDITERKRMEDALRESEEKYRTLLENLPQKIFFKDKNSVYISCNENYARDLKIKSNQIAGRTDYDFYPKELAEKYRADDKKVLGSGKTEDIEEDYIQDGQKVFVHTVKTPVKDENGNVVGILGIFWDITELKKAEQALRESEEKWRSLVKNAPNLIIIVDRNGTIQFINRTVIDATPEEVVGKGIYDFIDPKHHDLVRKTIEHVFQTGEHGSYEITGAGPNNETSWYDTKVGPIKHEDKIVSVTLITNDITQRKNMEEKLREYSERLEELVQKRTEELLESEKRYSVLVEEAGDGVIILQDGKIVFTNKKAAETIGYSKDEMIGLSLEKLVDEGSLPLAKEMYERNLRGETPTTFEVKWIAKTGERIPFEVSGARLHYKGRPAVLRVVRDIRERKRMEEQRLRLEKLAIIGELATMVGHDLRNPLQAITNAVYALKGLSESEDSSYERYKKILNLSPQPIASKVRQAMEESFHTRNEMTHVIDESVQYANKIVSDLQDFARPTEPKPTKVDLESLLQESLSDISIPENVKVSIRHDKTLPKLYVDPTQIKRIFTNLTTNAIQAMPNGGELAISTSLHNGLASIAFQDTGVGIQKVNMEKLFTPFFTTKAQGMGMGLAICKKFVEGHGGCIEVESEVGKGTTFTVKLPIPKENGGEKT